MHYVKISELELAKLKEYEDPRNWENWRELTPKLRYLVQRMAMGNNKKLVMEIAKDASHRLGTHKWCEGDCRNSYLDPAEEIVEDLAREIFGQS